MIKIKGQEISVEEFKEKYSQLKSSRKMGEYYGCDKGVILRIAKQIDFDNSQNKIVKLKKSDLEDILNLLKDKKSIDEIANIYSCSDNALRNFLNKNKVDYKKYTMKAIDKNFVINTYKENQSIIETSKITGYSTPTISKILDEMGIEKRQAKLNEEDKKFIIQNYKEMTSTELAKKFNVTRGMITKLWYDNSLVGKDIEVKNPYYTDLKGQEVGLWKVLEKTEERGPGGAVMWKCQCECGEIRNVSSNSLISKTSLSCGRHNISKGNLRVAEILAENNISFEAEKKFETCKDKKEMPFDFYVEDKYLIEFGGIQHYGEGLFDLEYTQRHDKMKNDWCKENNIPLIRIPYYILDTLTIEDLKLETTKYLV